MLNIIKDSNGKKLASFKPEKAFNSVVISTPEIKQGKTYTLTTGSASTSIKMDSLLYGSGGGMGGPGGNMGGPGGGMGGSGGGRKGGRH